MTGNGNTYAKGLDGEIHAISTLARVFPGWDWSLTAPTDPFDILGHGPDDRAIAIEVKAVRFAPDAKMAMHRRQIRRKKDWARDHDYAPVMLAVDPDTGQMLAREGVKCFPIDKMTSIEKVIECEKDAEDA